MQGNANQFAYGCPLQRILGGMYVTGVGVPQDDAEALMWLTIAAARSTGVGREKMMTARAAVASRMTPTDVHEAHPGMRNRAEPPSDTGRKGLSIALGLLFAL